MPPAADAALAAVAPRLAAIAEADPGREVCGLIVSGPGREVGRPDTGSSPGEPELWTLPNRALDPRRSYLLGPSDLLAALRRLDGEERSLLAVFHSHPDGGGDLSPRDLEAALFEGEPLLGGVAQVVVALRGGRTELVRVHRWSGRRYTGVDLWTSVR